MHYLLSPLEEHYDGGFGAIAISFKNAGAILSKEENADMFLGHLPRNFVLRHAVELYLKSSILILHRRFKIPFDESPWDGEPMVFDGKKWRPFTKVHSVAALFYHWEQIITPNATQIRDACEHHKPDWSVPHELGEWINTIEKADHNSTYYRYPSMKDPKENDKKSSFKETPIQGIFADQSESAKPVMAFILENEEGDVTRGFVLDRSTEKEETEALERAVDMLDSFQAMMRFELTGGW